MEWTHTLLPPVILIALAIGSQSLGWDQAIEDLFFSIEIHDFPARGWPALELWGHRVAKDIVVLTGILVAGMAIAARPLKIGTEIQSILFRTVVAMLAGSMLVVMLKQTTAHHCPWDLRLYGGSFDEAVRWFALPGTAGRCLPSGHAAAGFSLVALYFAGRYLGNSIFAWAGLVAGSTFGILFSLVRMAQGAHFLSHNLWSAALVWLTTAVIFVWAVPREAGQTLSHHSTS